LDVSRILRQTIIGSFHMSDNIAQNVNVQDK